MTEELDVPDEMITLVEVLIDRTSRKKIAWDKSTSETEFVYTRSSGSVVVSSVDNDGAQPFEIGILDANGRKVETYNSAEVRRVDFGSKLETLYVLARRSTVRSSPVVTELIEDFKNDDIPF